MRGSRLIGLPLKQVVLARLVDDARGRRWFKSHSVAAVGHDGRAVSLPHQWMASLHLVLVILGQASDALGRSLFLVGALSSRRRRGLIR